MQTAGLISMERKSVEKKEATELLKRVEIIEELCVQQICMIDLMKKKLGSQL